MSLWVGTYAKNGGRGLHPLFIIGDRLQIGAPVQEIANASFGVWNRRHRIAYFVDEQEAGRVMAWHFVEGRWSELSTAGSGGGAPCYLGLDARSGLLAVANYADGPIGLFSLDCTSGAIGQLINIVRPSGAGPDRDRQAGPHAHCVIFSEDGEWLYHVDLGLDRIVAYPIEGGLPGEPQLSFSVPPGSGPRHLMLHPDGQRALLICELSAELYLLERRNDTFKTVACRPTSPRQGENLGGHLATIGRDRAAVSNRGHDDITLFRLRASGLEREAVLPAHGSSPRHFWSDGKVVVVANEESGSVTLLPLDGGSPPDTIGVPGACFILHVPDD